MESDYEVGKNKPPKHTRWPKGHSGNPDGRRKGSRNLKTLLKEELNKKVQIREGGVSRQVSKREAVGKRLLEKALSGDLKAINLILQIEGDPDRDNAPIQLTKTDGEILQHYREQLENESTKTKPRKGKAKVDNRKRRSKRTSQD